MLDMSDHRARGRKRDGEFGDLNEERDLLGPLYGMPPHERTAGSGQTDAMVPEQQHAPELIAEFPQIQVLFTGRRDDSLRDVELIERNPAATA